MPTIEMGPGMELETARKVLAIYKASYPECHIDEDDNGNRVYTYPECKMVLNKDKPGALDEYFHACDLNSYRAALRAARNGAIFCHAVKPQGDKRPVKPADQKVLNGVY